MDRAQWVVAFALGSGACFMDQATMGGGDDPSSDAETGASTTASDTESASTSASTSMSTSMATSTSSTTNEPTTMDSNPTDTEPTDSAATMSDTMPVECAPDHACLPTGDGMWMGPMAVRLGASDAAPPQCPDAWTAGPSGFVDLTPSPFVCSCNCPDAPMPTCEFQVAFSDGNDCDGALLQSNIVAEGDCVPYSEANAHSVVVFDASDAVDCGAPQFEPPSPSAWSDRIDACLPPPGEACSMGVCVPEPPASFGGALCIAHTGDVMCPEGPFEVRHVAYADYDDDRDCDCECQSGGGSCSGTVTVSGTSNCIDDIGSNPVGSCIGGLTEAHSVVVTNAQALSSCFPLGSVTPTGEVTPVGAQTFCCLDA